MTITVTVEELRAYEKACFAWAHKRSEYFATQLVLVSSEGGLNRSVEQRPGIVAAIAHWEKENPAPRLIPSV
jgi:hypothetical protein